MAASVLHRENLSDSLRPIPHQRKGIGDHHYGMFRETANNIFQHDKINIGISVSHLTVTLGHLEIPFVLSASFRTEMYRAPAQGVSRIR